jgi:broad specificity phosphatase PhoE
VLILVRHGQTEFNASGRLVGRLDPSLTETGRRQAAAIASAVAGAARVVTSPLARARETAALLAPGLPLTVDERWIELDYGQWDGRPFADVPAEVWRQWRSDPSFAPPGGESLDNVGARVADACAELLPEAAASDIVVVSHVSPIKAAVAWALGVGQERAFRMHLANASVTRIGPATTGGPVLFAYNETAHLSPLD